MGTKAAELALPMSEEVTLTFNSSKDTFHIYPQFVTPALATKILESNNSNNRSPNPKVIASYARQMLDGLWRNTAEMVKIGADNSLFDGQHRLQAICLASEMSEQDKDKGKFAGVELIICSGVPANAMGAMDDGYHRTVSNAFEMRGMRVPKQSVVNSALTTLMVLLACTENGKHFEANAGAKRRSSSEIIAFYEKLPHFQKICTKFFATFRTNKIGKIMPLGAALAIYYLYHDINEETTYSILKSYESGIPVDGMGERSPSYKVYQRSRRAREMKIRVRPWEHITFFLWAYTKTLEMNKNSEPGKPQKMPNLMPWRWQPADNLIVSQAAKKLRKL